MQTFWRVTLPLLRPGIVAGAIFAAIISFGELAVTLLIAGARTTTLPLRIFNYTEYNFDPTINAVSTIFVVLALVLIIALDRLIGLVRIGRASFARETQRSGLDIHGRDRGRVHQPRVVPATPT